MRTLLFGNVTQPPFQNNLLPPVRAFEERGPVRIVEPRFVEGFVSTGGAKPALVPDRAVDEAAADFEADVVVCLAGGLYLSDAARARFPGTTIFAGFALSDPLGLEASIAIAPRFDLYYTQDPGAVEEYVRNGIPVRRCDPAVDPEMYRPISLPKGADLLFVGKWTPLRDAVLARLSRRFDVAVHGHAGESRWRFPASPPLDTPGALCEAINRARLMIEFTVMDDAAGPARGKSRMTNRPQFAAACGVPTLTDPFPGLESFFERGREIEVYDSAEDAEEKAAALLSDDFRRRSMGEAARARVLREQTWRHRLAMVERDVLRARNERSGG